MKSTYESFEPESYIQGVYYGLNNIAVRKQMTMSDYVKSISKQGTAEWSNYDGDLKQMCIRDRARRAGDLYIHPGRTSLFLAPHK